MHRAPESMSGGMRITIAPVVASMVRDREMKLKTLACLIGLSVLALSSCGRSESAVEPVVEPAVEPVVDTKVFRSGTATLEQVKAEIAKLPEESGLETKFKGGYTPLMMAVSGKSIEAVRALLEAGADVDARDDHGSTPLMYAVAGDDPNLKIILALAEAGADLHAKDRAGFTVSDWASHSDAIYLLDRFMKMQARAESAGKVPAPSESKPITSESRPASGLCLECGEPATLYVGVKAVWFHHGNGKLKTEGAFGPKNTCAQHKNLAISKMAEVIAALQEVSKHNSEVSLTSTEVVIR